MCADDHLLRYLVVPGTQQIIQSLITQNRAKEFPPSSTFGGLLYTQQDA